MYKRQKKRLARKCMGLPNSQIIKREKGDEINCEEKDVKQGK